MRIPKLSDERGIALALAVFALVVIGGLVAGIFFAGRLEQRSGTNTVLAAQAFEAAEAGLALELGNWDRSYNGLSVGEAVSVEHAAFGSDVKATTTVTRLNGTLFLVHSLGERFDANGTGPLAQRAVAALARLDAPQVEVEAAVTVRGAVTLSGSAEIDGTDNVPAGWGGSCDAPGTTMPGIRGSNLDIRDSGTCRDLECVTGDPKSIEDPSVTDETFNQFGSTTFDELAAGADLVIGSDPVNNIMPSLTSATPAECDMSDSNNWGEPHATTADPSAVEECFDYFPVIYAPGDAKLNGGRGQGMLLVQGNLELTGGAEFYGVVIVQGTVRSTGNGGHVYGGLMASNADLDNTLVSGNSVVLFSGCAVQRALRGATSATVLADRSWVQLY